MSVTIGIFNAPTLTAQPFGYEETDTSTGLTARKWLMSGLLTPAQWSQLLSVYDNWRDARISDADTLLSGTVGTTVSLTASANGLNWAGVACWFTSAPVGEQVGPYINATVEVVDAAQALAVLLRQEEKNRQRNESDLPDLGTLTLGSAVITLTSPMETRSDGPAVSLTAAGTSYVTGALTAHRVYNVEGYISSGTYNDLLSWYDSAVATRPTTNDWFPTTPPSASAEVIITGGVKSTRYNVQLTLLQII